MKIEKNKFLHILSEEIQHIAEQGQLTTTQVQDIVNKLLKKLDSIDMSLDMIYGALAGGSSSLATIRTGQAGAGRAYGAHQDIARSRSRGMPLSKATRQVTNERKFYALINEEISNVLNEAQYLGSDDEEEHVDSPMLAKGFKDASQTLRKVRVDPQLAARWQAREEREAEAADEPDEPGKEAPEETKSDKGNIRDELIRIDRLIKGLREEIPETKELPEREKKIVELKTAGAKKNELLKKYGEALGLSKEYAASIAQYDGVIERLYEKDFHILQELDEQEDDAGRCKNQNICDELNKKSKLIDQELELANNAIARLEEEGAWDQLEYTDDDKGKGGELTKGKGKEKLRHRVGRRVFRMIAKAKMSEEEYEKMDEEEMDRGYNYMFKNVDLSAEEYRDMQRAINAKEVHPKERTDYLWSIVAPEIATVEPPVTPEDPDDPIIGPGGGKDGGDVNIDININLATAMSQIMNQAQQETGVTPGEEGEGEKPQKPTKPGTKTSALARLDKEAVKIHISKGRSKDQRKQDQATLKKAQNQGITGREGSPFSDPSVDDLGDQFGQGKRLPDPEDLSIAQISKRIKGAKGQRAGFMTVDGSFATDLMTAAGLDEKDPKSSEAVKRVAQRLINNALKQKRKNSWSYARKVLKAALPELDKDKEAAIVGVLRTYGLLESGEADKERKAAAAEKRRARRGAKKPPVKEGISRKISIRMRN